MVGTAQIRWCPHCRTWGKAKRLLVDPSEAFLPGHGCDPVSFDYVREDYRCHACAEDFSATRITRCRPEYVWSARNMLAKLDAQGMTGRSRRAIPLSWEGHPELADFSGLAPARTALGH